MLHVSLPPHITAMEFPLPKGVARAYTVKPLDLGLVPGNFIGLVMIDDESGNQTILQKGNKDKTYADAVAYFQQIIFSAAQAGRAIGIYDLPHASWCYSDGISRADLSQINEDAWAVIKKCYPMLPSLYKPAVGLDCHAMIADSLEWPLGFPSVTPVIHPRVCGECRLALLPDADLVAFWSAMFKFSRWGRKITGAVFFADEYWSEIAAGRMTKEFAYAEINHTIELIQRAMQP